MDTPSHFIFGLERKNGQRRLIHFLWPDTGQLLHESAYIWQCEVTFHENLFKEEFQENPEVVQEFYEGLLKVSLEADAELDVQISAAELHAALQSLESSKIPGIDRLPADIYKVFWPLIREDLLSVLRDSLNKGKLPLT